MKRFCYYLVPNSNTGDKKNEYKYRAKFGPYRIGIFR